MSKYLTEQEFERFDFFIKEMSFSYRQLAKLLHRKSPQGIFASLKKKKIKRETARMISGEVKSILKTIEGI